MKGVLTMASITLTGGPKGNTHQKWYRDGADLVKELEKALTKFKCHFVLRGVRGLRGRCSLKGIHTKQVDTAKNVLWLDVQIGDNASRWQYTIHSDAVKALDIREAINLYLNPPAKSKVKMATKEVVTQSKPTNGTNISDRENYSDAIKALEVETAEYTQAGQTVARYKGRDLDTEVSLARHIVDKLTNELRSKREKLELLKMEKEDLDKAKLVLANTKHQAAVQKLVAIRQILEG